MFSSTLRTTAIRRSLLIHPARRTFQSSPRFLASKDAQGKDDLKPESNEYSKSGSDQASAAVEDAAFNPQKTSPEAEYASANTESGAKGEDNPLNASPANQKLSGTTGNDSSKGSPAEAGAGEEGGSGRSRTSGGGSAPKSGG